MRVLPLFKMDRAEDPQLCLVNLSVSPRLQTLESSFLEFPLLHCKLLTPLTSGHKGASPCALSSRSHCLRGGSQSPCSLPCPLVSCFPSPCPANFGFLRSLLGGLLQIQL